MIGVVAGLYPALSVARLAPTSALRTIQVSVLGYLQDMDIARYRSLIERLGLRR